MQADYVYPLDLGIWYGKAELHIGYVLPEDSPACPHTIGGRIHRALVIDDKTALCLDCLVVACRTVGRAIA